MVEGGWNEKTSGRNREQTKNQRHRQEVKKNKEWSHQGNRQHWETNKAQHMHRVVKTSDVQVINKGAEHVQCDFCKQKSNV